MKANRAGGTPTRALNARAPRSSDHVMASPRAKALKAFCGLEKIVRDVRLVIIRVYELEPAHKSGLSKLLH